MEYNDAIFPTELVAQIVDHLHNDIASLAALALVSRSCCVASRYHLFTKITVRAVDASEATFQDFGNFLASRPLILYLQMFLKSSLGLMSREDFESALLSSLPSVDVPKTHIRSLSLQLHSNTTARLMLGEVLHTMINLEDVISCELNYKLSPDLLCFTPLFKSMGKSLNMLSVYHEALTPSGIPSEVIWEDPHPQFFTAISACPLHTMRFTAELTLSEDAVYYSTFHFILAVWGLFGVCPDTLKNVEFQFAFDTEPHSGSLMADIYFAGIARNAQRLQDLQMVTFSRRNSANPSLNGLDGITTTIKNGLPVLNERGKLLIL
ncbi:hypothetical protein EIP91_006895 [Steccherinum ochraceum]|uniref:F-box domain-containing protein n=1 Tax=Steccherinum ochraceum TaxID=92696 RepID=A0A4R0RJG0_9APHY|nr:hypothetical protein EIP91_006895 [Steccherinum ochraceum]